MQGGAGPADEDKRTPMRFTSTAPGHGFSSAKQPWHDAPEAAGVDVASQRKDGLWRSYQRLIALRHAHPALSTGSATRPTVEGGGRGAFALVRAQGGDRVLVVANLAAQAAPDFTVDVAGAPTVVHASARVDVEAHDGRLRVRGLGPRAFAFIALDR